MARHCLLLTLAFAALTLGGLSASAPAGAGKAPYWIVIASNRDGETRGYSLRADGSRLSPLLPRTSSLVPVNVLRDGRTIAYYDAHVERAYVSRANGTHLRRIAYPGLLSSDGKLVAFERRYQKNKEKNGLWVVGSDGRGMRRLPSNQEDELLMWSPDARSVALLRDLGDNRYGIVIQPLRGQGRVIVRGLGLSSASWSPDGRWIAYDSSYRDSKQDGLYLIEPTGRHRHRVVTGAIWGYAWSRDGRRLAATVGYPSDLAVVGVDGEAPQRRHLRHVANTMTHLTWSPDDRLIAFDGFLDDNRQDVWVVGADGRGLRRVTTVGANHVVGWSRLAPVQPRAMPLLPSERVTGATTVATRRPITGLSADGARVAFTPASTGADCGHPVVWTPGAKTLDRFGAPKPCGYDDGVADVILAGSRVAWIDLDGCGNNCYFGLSTATLEQRRPQKLTDDSSEGGYDFDYHLRGEGDLLVFNDGSQLLRIGADGKPSTIRSGAHACCADSASGGLIAILESEAVAILDEQGRLLRIFPFSEHEVSAVRLDGGHLVVARSAVLDVYDVSSGALVVEQRLPQAYRLEDVDGGVAMLRRKDDTIMLLRLDNGRSFTLAPGAAPRLADLEATGLYYSYTTPEGEGRLVFLPRDQVARRLGGAS